MILTDVLNWNIFDYLTGKGTHNLGCPSRFGTSIWLWPVSHVALLAVTWPRPTRSSELPKGGGPWLGKSSTLGTKIDPIYIYIQCLVQKYLEHSRTITRECLLTGSVTGGLPFADNSGSVTLPVSVDITMGPKSMSFGYSGDLCRGSLVANCERLPRHDQH